MMIKSRRMRLAGHAVRMVNEKFKQDFGWKARREETTRET
jgi:hypothetical protein